MGTELLEEPDFCKSLCEGRGAVSGWRRFQPFEHAHASGVVLRRKNRIGAQQTGFRDGFPDHREQVAFNARPDRASQIPQRAFGRDQEATLIQPEARMLHQLVEREGFGSILAHPRFKLTPAFSSDRRQAEVPTSPDLMLVLRLVTMVERAK